MLYVFRAFSTWHRMTEGFTARKPLASAMGIVL